MKLQIRTSLQTKLILSLLTVVVLSGAGAIMVGKAIINKSIVNQAYSNVGQTLEMFSDIYANKLYVKHRLVSTVASYAVFQRDVRDRSKSRIYHVIRELLRDSNFDILNVTDDQGRVLIRSKNTQASGDLVRQDPYVQRVLDKRVPVYGFDVMPREQLLKESTELAERALVPVIPTDRSRANEKSIETRGLFLKVASPIYCDNVFVGVIYGALLINNDSSIPDRARSLVFGDEKVDGRDIGTVTLFLDDLRVSTNVRDKDGRRAVGTMVSQEVFRKVYEGGGVWKDKAFVVDRWFMAAYKPLRDLDGKTIGMIYTGILEDKYVKIERNAMISFLMLTTFAGCVSVLLAWYLVHHFISPIRALVIAAQGLAAGHYSKVEVETNDEMGYLGQTFNDMVAALEAKDRRLMEHVEKQIQQTEKLASLGRLASGIAHEINNPLTGVLTYSGVLEESLKGTEHEEDLKVIREETLRCREIVRGILDFARETKLERTSANINQIIRECLVILEKHVTFQNVRIIQELDASLPDSFVDVNQIKSVINNLAMNAADAMPNGGKIRFKTSTSQERKVIHVRVSDTGVGIKEEDLPKVFDPFFTTKETGKGTGLGLSVTYGVIKRHNGLINITSKVGVGTTIDMQIPVESEVEGQ